MNKFRLYRTTILICLFSVRTLDGWGSEASPLPRPFLPPATMTTDTVPPVKTTETKPAEAAPQDPVTDAVKPVIKQIPKSKKQVKPVAVPGKLPVKTPTIIKPKIIIRRIGL